MTRNTRRAFPVRSADIAGMAVMTRDNIEADRIIQALSEYQSGDRFFKSLLGFDGFVDEIMHVVDKRHNAENFTKINTLADYGARISRSAGLSTNVELVGFVRKLGGNGPILANALAEQGVSVTYIGALGETSIHPVFEPMHEKCELISIADPGLSFNLEFDDGKLIMSKLDSLNVITWEAIKDRFGLEKFARMIGNERLDLIGLVNWVLIPNLSGIFRGIIEEAFPLTKPTNCLAFFDLCDTEKRLKEDLAEAVALIKRFSSRYRVAFGTNLREALQVAAALGLDALIPPEGSVADIDLEELTVGIGEALGIYCFVIHTVYDAGAYAEGKYHHAPGFFTPTPILTTGGGDNFNAGLCMGLLLNLSFSEALLLGTASSGYYVRNAKSANLPELIDFIKINTTNESF